MGIGAADTRGGRFKDFCPNCHYCRDEAQANCIVVTPEDAEEYNVHVRDHVGDEGFYSTTVRT